MKATSLRVLALVATLGFVACGDDDPAGLTGDLNQEEAEDLAGVLMLATFASTGGIPATSPAQSGPALAPYSFSSEIDTTVECPEGGTVDVMAAVTISGDTESEAAHIEYTMTQVHQGCIATSERGRTFTLNGATPPLTLTFSVDTDGESSIEWDGSVTGTVAWATDGRDGTCGVNMEFDGSANLQGATSAMVTGSVCGVNVTQSLSVG